MPTIIDFTLARSERGSMTVSTNPPTAIGGWSLQYTQTLYHGGLTALVTKSMASGFYNTSGMTILNSGQGIYSVNLFPAEVSGLDPAAYAYGISRTDSGYQTELVKGFRLQDY